MAYDRYENRGGYRDNDRERGYRGGEQQGGDNERGFFERARDEVQSWFGDDDAERRRYQDDREGHRESSRYEQSRPRGGREDDRFGRSDRGASYGGGQSTSYGRGRDEGDYRNQYGRGGGESGGFGGGDYSRQGTRYPSSYGQTGGGSYQAPRGRDEDYGSRQRYEQRSSGMFGGRDRDEDNYRPMTGDYGRGSSGSGMGGQDFGRSQYGRQEFSQDQDRDRSGQRYNYGGWGDDDSRRQSGGGIMGRAAAAGAAAFGGARSGTPHDEHYSSWRQRQMEELDRDYDDYRREHQSKFENEFSGWRQQKQTKRQMLNAIREHNEVVDQNGERIGTVDKVHGDKVILTKNDPEAGGVHRSFSCTLLERVEDGKVYLSGTKDSIRSRLTEEREDDGNRSSGGGILGGLFGGGRDDDRQEQMRQQQRASSSSDDGPHILDRSFSGTYEDDKKNR